MPWSREAYYMLSTPVGAAPHVEKTTQNRSQPPTGVLPVSAWDDLALRHYYAAEQAFLHHEDGLQGALDAALERDPGLPLAHVLRAYSLALLARPEHAGTIARAADQAQRHLWERAHHPREAALVASVAQLQHGPDACLEALRRAMDAAPDCALSAKLHHALAFMHGRLAASRTAISFAADKRELHARPIITGLLAFTAGEALEFSRAEALARAALDLDPEDVWAFHALVHALGALGRASEALRLLDARTRRFPRSSNIGAHLAWHAAMLHVDMGTLESALALYDHELEPSLGADYRDLANCTALLQRCAQAGADVAQRTNALAEHAAALPLHTLPFADAHALIALLAAGRRDAARRLLFSARSVGYPHATSAAREAGLLLLALIASDTPPSAVALSAVRAALPALGGSRTQRGLFLAILNDLEAGRTFPA